MAQYRIVKIEHRNKTYFRIQKKFLLWYFNFGVVEKYFEYQGMALIRRRKYDYFSLEQAQEILSKIKNPFELDYNGNLIVRVFGDVVKDFRTYHLRDVYINYSGIDYWNGHIIYEFSETVEGLKNIIDNRQSKRKITVIS